MRALPGWDQTPAYDGSYERLPAGGYVCIIRSAEEVKSKTHKEMLSLTLDIAEGSYAGFFKRRFEQKSKSSSVFSTSWPCVFNQLLLNGDGETSPYFKGLITSIEDSNPGYGWSFDEKSLRNKIVGMIFREEEFVANDGKILTNVKPAFPRNVDVIRNGQFTVPEIKKIASTNSGYGLPSTSSSTGFAPVDDETLPW